ncbi:hypothetical protein ACFQ07_30510 [Actinomadura adrarensis]|uniref:Uncharacterized protein n=1 Tax=Actinomadura adrarensis TaxID=1819600 RepID=A0ABW3CPZ9_9ACTN
MTRKSKLDLYDLLRITFGNDIVDPDKLPGAARRAERPEAKAAFRPRRRTSRSGPVTVRRPDPRVWKVARAVAGADTSRLEVLADGSVFIHNRPIR